MIRHLTRRLARSIVLALGLGFGLNSTCLNSVTLNSVALGAPVAVGPAAQPFHLGGMRLVVLRDADNVLDNDGKVFGAGVGPAAVAGVLSAAGAPTDKITLGVDALLVRSPGRVMLFDTGLGPAVHGALMASLAQAGVSPGEITDVFITHSHGDHVGGLATADGRRAFPHGMIRMSAREWTWMQAQPRNQALVKLIAPQVRPFEPGDALGPGVRSIALYGHTPGHVGYEIGTGTDRLMDIGDTAHSSIVSLAKPDWTIGYDNDAKAGPATRRATLSRLAATQEWVFAPHFPYPGIGRIKAAGDGFVWVPGSP